MQPNKSLVFYLANEDTGDTNDVHVPEKQLLASYQEEWDAQAKNTMSLVQERVAKPSAPIQTQAPTQTSEPLPLEEALETEVFDPELFFTEHLKDAIVEPNALLSADEDDEDDWILGLEQLRNQRRHQEEALSPVAQLAKPKLSQFAQVEHSALSGVLKVTSVKATHLYQPAAQAIAAGKDLDTVTLHMQEASMQAKKASAEAVVSDVSEPVEELEVQETEVKEVVTKAIVDKLLLPETEEIVPKVEDAVVFMAVEEVEKANAQLFQLQLEAEAMSKEKETAVVETVIAQENTEEAKSESQPSVNQPSNEMVFSSIQEIKEDLDLLVTETLGQVDEVETEVETTLGPVPESKSINKAEVAPSQSPSKKAKAPTQPLVKLLVKELDEEETDASQSKPKHHIIEPTAAPVRTDSLLLDESSGLSLQMQMKQLKEAAKKVPIEPWYVEPAPLAKKSVKVESIESEEVDPALLAKAEEVVQKTALTPEEKVTLLDGFLSLWQDRQQSKKATATQSKIVFKEEWQQHNESILQSDTASDQPSEAVMWLKTQPDLPEGEQEAMVIEPEIVAEPNDLSQKIAYAPIHVHVNMPKEEDDAIISVISEEDLLSQLTERLQPYFVDMLTGLVKTELTKQSHLLVQRLQENLAAEIPMMVDELLQENLSKALAKIKNQGV